MTSIPNRFTLGTGHQSLNEPIKISSIINSTKTFKLRAHNTLFVNTKKQLNAASVFYFWFGGGGILPLESCGGIGGGGGGGGILPLLFIPMLASSGCGLLR